MKRIIFLLMTTISSLFAQDSGTSLPEQVAQCYEKIDLTGFYTVGEHLDLSEGNDISFYDTFYKNHQKSSVNIQGTIVHIDTSRFELTSNNGKIILYYFTGPYSVETSIKVSLTDVELNIPEGNDSAMYNAFDPNYVFIPSSMKKIEIGEKIEIENYLAIANDSCHANRLGIPTQIHYLAGNFKSNSTTAIKKKILQKKEKKILHKNVKGQSLIHTPAYCVEF